MKNYILYGWSLVLTHKPKCMYLRLTIEPLSLCDGDRKRNRSGNVGLRGGVLKCNDLHINSIHLSK